MMEIPKQLHNPEFRFCLIRKQSKAPFEKDWANNGYSFDNPKLLKHIENGGNYGVIGGYGGLIILDKDSTNLPIDIETFTIKTGSGGKHYYILSDYQTNHVFVNEMGELRAKNYQVVGAGSMHPNGNNYEVFKDIPIKTIPAEELKEIIKPYLREEQNISTGNERMDKKEDTSRSGLEFRKVLALLRKGKSREEVYDIMNAYSKWISSPEQYKSLTFEKAENLYLQEEEVKKETPTDTAKKLTQEEVITIIQESYYKIIKILKRYLDWKEENYNIVALWVIGTYFHKEFPTYPYLFLNATKGSGKSRALNLISTLCKDGSVLNSLTEAVLFRTTGTLAIDEFEGVERKGKESLKELLNSAYKKGVMVKRMRKVKNMDGESQEVEEFDVYRPILIANISGMENVLGDRCIQLIIEKSFDTKRTDLLELFLEDSDIQEVKKKLFSVVSVDVVIVGNVAKKWNDFVMLDYNYTNYTNYTNNTNYTNYTNQIISLYNLKGKELTGRNFELSFPLMLISLLISDEISKITTLNIKELFNARKDEDLLENSDTSLVDMISQESEEKELAYTLMNNIVEQFRQFTQINEDWLNNKWMGRALKRLNLIKDKRRTSRGIEVRLNIKHAQEKIKMFK